MLDGGKHASEMTTHVGVWVPTRVISFLGAMDVGSEQFEFFAVAVLSSSAPWT